MSLVNKECLSVYVTECVCGCMPLYVLVYVCVCG